MSIETRPAKASLAGYVTGVLAPQIANNAMHLIQPLVIAELSGSLGLAALVASAETGVHMLGTLVSGGPADRLGSRRTLILATALRAASLALIPLAWAFGGLTLIWALTAYTLDAFVRGGVLGALLYPRAQNRLSCAGWVLGGSCGTLALAVGWIPGTLWPMLAAAAFFGLANACAELSLLRRLQERTPVETAGRVMSAARLACAAPSRDKEALQVSSY